MFAVHSSKIFDSVSYHSCYSTMRNVSSLPSQRYTGCIKKVYSWKKSANAKSA